MRGLSPGGPFSQVRWIECLNVGSIELAAHSIAEVEKYTFESGTLVARVKRPTADHVPQIAIIGATSIGVDKSGVCTVESPALVSYDSANTPSVGQAWGPQQNQLTVKKGNRGLIVLSDPSDGLVMVERGFYKSLVRVTLAAALATTDASKTATITNQYGPGWSSPDTGAGAVTLHNLLTHTAGTYVFEGDSGGGFLAEWDYGTNYRAINGECP